MIAQLIEPAGQLPAGVSEPSSQRTRHILRKKYSNLSAQQKRAGEKISTCLTIMQVQAYLCVRGGSEGSDNPD